jgi:uncharacterized protein YuzE
MDRDEDKMIYDPEYDILNLSKGKKVRHSISVGDFIFDIDFKGFVTGVEVHDASKNLGISEKQLISLKEASMRVNYKPDKAFVFLTFRLEDKEKEIAIPIKAVFGEKTFRTENAKFAAS